MDFTPASLHDPTTIVSSHQPTTVVTPHHPSTAVSSLTSLHNNIYDLCIVGAGMFGSAAARHASANVGVKVCLVGPEEPSVSLLAIFLFMQ